MKSFLLLLVLSAATAWSKPTSPTSKSSSDSTSQPSLKEMGLPRMVGVPMAIYGGPTPATGRLIDFDAGIAANLGPFGTASAGIGIGPVYTPLYSSYNSLAQQDYYNGYGYNGYSLPAYRPLYGRPSFYTVFNPRIKEPYYAYY